MVELSEVPLQVLEEVRDKWLPIHSHKDKRISHRCAMCGHVDNNCAVCPIWVICAHVVNSNADTFECNRQKLLTIINTEIQRRAEVMP